MKKFLPHFLKPLFRFIYYKQERAKVFREFKIKSKQNQLIKQYDPDAKKIIVFLVTGADWHTGTDKISGGTISIVSLCEESRKLKEVHNAEVIMCSFPGSHLLLHHTQFKNTTIVFRFHQIRSYFKNADTVLLHIPEFLSTDFLNALSYKDKLWLKNLRAHLNIMNQNIQLMPSPADINELKNFDFKVTITTAHQQYCNQFYRELYKVSLHKFSVWISPEKYHFRVYEEKDNIIVVSPDQHEMKDAVLRALKSVDNLRVQIIQNLTYEKYKEVISKAKWAITFGEGLDGYVIEPVFSGTVAFTVFNKDFFTEDYKKAKGIYESYNQLLSNIVNDIKDIDNKQSYQDFQKQQFDLFAKHYNYKVYQNNIKYFYEEKYTYP
jgi:hypothetical protein